jgi:peptide/nickel transport system ATP-binding protein
MRMPYTEALVQSIPQITNHSHTRLNAIGGRPPDLVNLPTGCRFAERCRYAQEKCLDEMPPLIAAPSPGHEFRCWFPVGTPEGEEALARNIERGYTAAGPRAIVASQVGIDVISTNLEAAPAPADAPVGGGA